MNKIYTFLKKKKSNIIGIDGELGAGKSTISKIIAKKINCQVIHLDNYLIQKQGVYVNAIKFEELKKDVKKCKFPVIIEGVCLLYVLKRIDIYPDTLFFVPKKIYTKKATGVALEVREYIIKTEVNRKADIIMSDFGTNEFDTDIAYIKYNTFISIILAIGGIASLVTGSSIILATDQTYNTIIFEIAKVKITANGIGSAVLGSSVVWAYFSYLARPKYRRIKTARTNHASDEIWQNSEVVATTMAITSKTIEYVSKEFLDNENGAINGLPPPHRANA